MIAVREASGKDVDVVYELIMAIARYHNQEEHVLTNKAELERSGFGPSPKFGVLLAKIDGEVAGYLSYTWNYSIWLGSLYMNIDDVFVWEKYRGKKIGEALMDKAREVCRSRGAQRVKWEVQQDNNKAIRFYERLGAEIEIKGVCRWGVE